ncbi:MAG: secondary thiamine-phosphate synthase enzyme YjbQ [Acidimicrobiales bacterium]
MSELDIRALAAAVPAHSSGPEVMSIRTERAFQLVDLTDGLRASVASTGLGAGALHLFCPHTSAGLAITEMEDGLHADFEAVLEELASRQRPWAHDDHTRRWQNIEHDGRLNGWSHIQGLLATLPMLVLPIVGGTLGLGAWQRVFFVELDGPRDRRSVTVQAWGSPPAA